ncbi:MAG TPA: hypothetical protein PKM69_01765 [Bacteroidales bacterium]|nr:hypothetical protein [Bacteroidales bacterium]
MKTDKKQLTDKANILFSLILFIFVVTGCTGPRGYDGLDGRDGADGINYTRSAIYDVNTAEWYGDLNGYDAFIDVPEITEDIYYNGAVLVYRLIETDPKSFNMLPYSYVDNTLTVSMDFDAYVGSIDLIYKEVLNGVNNTPAPENTLSFKVVIIEGLPLAKLKNMVDVSDYSAVAKMFNLDKKLNTVN